MALSRVSGFPRTSSDRRAAHLLEIRAVPISRCLRCGLMLNIGSAMPSYDLLTLAKSLAREFERRNMDFHLESLRQYFGGHSPNAGAEEWTEKMLIEWLALFGVPPFAHVYPVRAAGSPCTQCRARSVRVNVVTLFAGGSKRSCLTCGSEWVERSAANG